MMLPAALLLTAMLVFSLHDASVAHAFPLDGAEETGITRLEGYRLAQQGKVAGNRLYPGALLNSDDIHLRLQQQADLTLPPTDRKLTAKIVKLLGADAVDYSISVLDLSDPEQIRYAEHQANIIRNPGSVGKLLVVLAVFQALADVYPDDIQARMRVLRDSDILADAFIRSDHHKVPFWLPQKNRLLKRRLAEHDVANFWTYLDWMMSASSNAAAAMVFKHVMLLRHFGRDYPVSTDRENSYFDDTPKKQLSQDLFAALKAPVARNNLDPDKLRQGGFFSYVGKRRVPGINSLSTTRELMRYVLLLEQGKLVDAWSSLQIKRLMYLTQRRIRYASSPALKDAAVYFKSGSFYKCRAEPGFVCKKYSGNVLNLMNSVIMIETPGLHYMVTVTSNVLRQNSAVAQQTLATRVHRLLQALHPVHAGLR